MLDERWKVKSGPYFPGLAEAGKWKFSSPRQQTLQPPNSPMLTISKEQFDALGVASFQDRMVNILREHFPEQLEGMDETELRQEIVNQARKAQLYGLTAEQPAAFFVLTAWLFGLGSMKKYPRWPPH